MSQAFIQPGFIVLHSNQSESLAEALVAWIGSHPLDPLEEEVILVLDDLAGVPSRSKQRHGRVAQDGAS